MGDNFKEIEFSVDQFIDSNHHTFPCPKYFERSAEATEKISWQGS